MKGKYYVFEKHEDGKLLQVSIDFESQEDAESFIETMREGFFYKRVKKDIPLIIMMII